MAHREEVASLTSQQTVAEPQYQCACCEGIVENLSSDAIPNGLDLWAGFFSDECILISNACTSQLVAANEARPADRRR